jgi:hypothetical protein
MSIYQYSIPFNGYIVFYQYTHHILFSHSSVDGYMDEL